MPRSWAEIYERLGETGAEEMLCDAMEDMALRLARIDRYHRAGAFGSLGQTAEGLQAVARRIGMKDLARVARDVSICAMRRDRVGLAATQARLSRVGDRSLTEIWDPGEFTG
ncbi:hypothetical protein [Qingshengfaniella alkalisoli]|uniref:Uncharacterized protein n=1 Tax=Qingshengfaniella alkalisoli TaxID=2599296 RepID=A0A5B8IW97_9RHOB|nr:hypothetical protein [Qingshengfaniella alkalisoli]QDY69783.1 hypothetical protein FPZ52_09220 [Qingshengfaniella alkalisoli]